MPVLLLVRVASGPIACHADWDGLAVRNPRAPTRLPILEGSPPVRGIDPTLARLRAPFPNPAGLDTALGTGFVIDLVLDGFARRLLPFVALLNLHFLSPMPDFHFLSPKGFDVHKMRKAYKH